MYILMDQYLKYHICIAYNEISITEDTLRLIAELLTIWEDRLHQSHSEH